MSKTLTLTNVTNEIIKIETGINKNMFQIANLLALVAEKELYKTGDYKNMVDYGEDALGYKKATTYALIQVSQRFLKGKAVSLIKKEDEKDYTVSQLRELLTLTDEQLSNGIENGEITPNKSARELKEYVKALKKLEDKKMDVEEIPHTKDYENGTERKKNEPTYKDEVDSEDYNPAGKFVKVTDEEMNVDISNIKTEIVNLMDNLNKFTHLCNIVIDNTGETTPNQLINATATYYDFIKTWSDHN